MSKFLSFLILVLLGVLGAVYFGYIPISDWRKTPPPPLAAISGEPKKLEPTEVVCTGMVEATGGEIDVFAQMPGELVEVNAHEGDTVQKGDKLAVLDARRQDAQIAVAAAAVGCAQAKLKRIEAGVGKEEKQEALFSAEAIAASLKYETDNRDRLRKLYKTKAISLDVLDASENQVNHLQKQMQALQQHYESLRRGPLPEEIDLARAEVNQAEEQLHQAKVEVQYHTVYAPVTGVVLQVYRHAGDSVSVQQQTPIVRLVDAAHLRIRLEIDEAYASRLKPPRAGTFEVGGNGETVGRLELTTIIPQFGPKRLFNPDTSARMDTRILDVLCDIKECRIPLYTGQRITAQIPLENDRAAQNGHSDHSP
jgi:multidrug resistance efflux pump